MSSDFYFRKWKKTLAELEETVNIDVHLQKTKAHDKTLCEATERLSGILARYQASYNQLSDCLHQNLQVQKTTYMRDILKAVVSRILELKHEVQKLEVSEHHFGNNGLIDHRLIPEDAELTDLPEMHGRRPNIQALIEQVFEQVKERKRQLEAEAEEGLNTESPEGEQMAWWDADNTSSSDRDLDTNENKKGLTEEQQEIKRMVELIQAQEKSRQVIFEKTQKQNKRQKWEKELAGTLPPPARLHIREQAAKLIQQVFRAFFTCKRDNILNCKRNELLGLTPCLKPKSEQKYKWEQIKEIRKQLKIEYEEKWKSEYESLKHFCLKRKIEDIQEDYRDYIRDWFKTWHEAVKFFHDIPGENLGGATLIFKEELPTPEEWLDEYNAYMADKKANKRKSSMDKKFAKLEEKRQEMELKRTEHMKQKMEEQLRRKMMKNPSLHPGYDFPTSKKTDNLSQVINNYYKEWADLDAKETIDVKVKSVRDIDVNKAYAEVKMEVVPTVEDDMRQELKLLKKALKTDYENRNEKMPETMKQKHKREKNKKKVKQTLSTNMAEKLEDLVFHGYMVEYPKTKLDEFVGDPNFAGDDLRCDCRTALPHNGNTRELWWERCREMSQGFHRILLVGPHGSGKTTLLYALATMNDAVLFELDPRLTYGLVEPATYLKHWMQVVGTCAKAVQPSVIHIKHVYKLFYRKVPPEDAGIDWKLIQRFYTKTLFKQFSKTDKVTVIGSCIEPWLARSNQVLKQFPTVVLLPNTSHGTVAHILKEWVLSHTVIPADFEITCLAQVLRGYSFGYLKDKLKKFLTADTIISIAARGLSPMDVYNFIIQDDTEDKIDYDKYLSWYKETTVWGKKEQKHREEQLEFKRALAEFALRAEKKKKANQKNMTN